MPAACFRPIFIIRFRWKSGNGEKDEEKTNIGRVIIAERPEQLSYRIHAEIVLKKLHMTPETEPDLYHKKVSRKKLDIGKNILFYFDSY